MADCVDASILLGGTITAPDYAELVEIIATEGLSINWDEEPFDPNQRTIGEPLSLCAYQVPWGQFKVLEAWCVKKKLPFARWAGACAGQFGAERVVFSGADEPACYFASDDDRVLIDRGTVQNLRSIKAILAYFDAADVEIPPLVVEGDPAPPPEVSPVLADSDAPVLVDSSKGGA